MIFEIDVQRFREGRNLSDPLRPCNTDSKFKALSDTHDAKQTLAFASRLPATAASKYLVSLDLRSIMSEKRYTGQTKQ